MHAAEDTLINGSAWTRLRSAGYSESLFTECLEELAIEPLLGFLPRRRGRCSRVWEPRVKTQVVNKGFEQQLVSWRVFEQTSTFGRVLDRGCIQALMRKAAFGCYVPRVPIRISVKEQAWRIQGWIFRTGEKQPAALLKLSCSGSAKCEPHRSILWCNHHFDQTGCQLTYIPVRVEGVKRDDVSTLSHRTLEHDREKCARVFPQPANVERGCCAKIMQSCGTSTQIAEN
jgi:hypothetical protein